MTTFQKGWKTINASDFWYGFLVLLLTLVVSFAVVATLFYVAGIPLEGPLVVSTSIPDKAEADLSNQDVAVPEIPVAPP